jgi:hypothetical protein
MNPGGLFVSGSGNVGIGTSSNLYGKLSVEAAGNHITLRAPGATAGKYWALDITTANQFYVINNAGTQYFTMTDGGNFGIGTPSPSTRLHVANSASAVLFSESSSVATIIGTNAAGNASQELSLRGFPLTFTGNGGGGSEAMRITSGGNVLINRTTDQATGTSQVKLAVNGPVNVGSAINNTSFPTRDDGGLGVYVGSGANAFQVWDDNQFSYPRFIVQRAGNVGIGTSSPNFRLQVRPTADVNMIVTNNGSNLQIGSSNDAGNAAIPINFTATSFTFNNTVTFNSEISMGTNQRLKLSGGAGNLKGSAQSTISSTVVTIFEGYELGGVQTGNLVIVNGVKSGTGWNFTDLVNYMTNGSVVVFSSSTVNSPPARTYTVSGTNLRLSIAGGDTGFVSCTALTQGYQA